MTGITAVQIIGTQRSGSNLLRLMLNQLGNVFAPHPPHILSTFYPLLPAYGDLNKDEHFQKLIDDVCRLVELNPVPWEGLLADRQQIFEACQYRSLSEIFRVIYALNAQQQHAKVWVCKSMQNVRYLESFREISLHPKIIYLYRDGRDVALSFQKAIVGPKHAYAIAKKWNEEQLLSLRYLNQYTEAEALAVRYESLIVHPENEMKKICAFLRLPYQQEFMQYYTSEESRKTAEAGSMWGNLIYPVMSQNINKFKDHLTAEEIAIFEKVARESLQRLGYSPHTQKPLPDFSPAQIEDFQAADIQMMVDAQKQARKSDVEKRSAQNQWIKTLEERYRQLMA